AARIRSDRHGEAFAGRVAEEVETCDHCEPPSIRVVDTHLRIATELLPAADLSEVERRPRLSVSVDRDDVAAVIGQRDDPVMVRRGDEVEIGELREEAAGESACEEPCAEDGDGARPVCRSHAWRRPCERYSTSFPA